MSAVVFDSVSIVFGAHPERALPLMDAGADRETVGVETGQVLGVHDCCLEVARGETLVLMGLSGSGKSTLLRAVNGLNPVARGAVHLATSDGMVNVTRASDAVLRDLRRHQVAMVFQHFGLLPWRSVLENVAFGLEIAGVPVSERRTRAQAQLALVGLEDWADRALSELSGGMQQRVGLARAFATEAPVLLMDEPFSALDPLIRARLQDELLDFQARLDRTIIFVSHDLDEAFRIGDRIAIMQGGRIVQCGTPRQIVAAPASDYVADFVAHMNPLAVLCAGDLAVPGPPEGPPVPAERPLKDILSELSAHPAMAVQGPEGHIGQIRRADVLARLAGESVARGPQKESEALVSAAATQASDPPG